MIRGRFDLLQRSIWRIKPKAWLTHGNVALRRAGYEILDVRGFELVVRVS